MLCSPLTDIFGYKAKTDSDKNMTKNMTFCLYHNVDNSSQQAFGEIFAVELICTIILVAVILNLKYNQAYSFSKNTLMSPISHSVVLFGMMTMTMGTSGACLNPAVGLVQSCY